jgi:hypothetical protein
VECAGGRSMWTKKLSRFVQEAIKAGLDDPFRCVKCKEEYDDLTYEG